MLLTERPRVLWSSVMSVNCTLICAVENLDNRVRKYKRCSLTCGMGPHSNEHRLHVLLAPYNAEIFEHKPWRPNGYFRLFLI